MKQVQATPAPKATYPSFIFVPYVYAALLAAHAVVGLMGMGGFDFAFIAYETPGLPVIIITIAAIEIFALPFLLRLTLSRLARFFSAVFALAAPFFVAGNMAYVAAGHGMAPSIGEVVGATGLIILALMSFTVLRGNTALLQK